MRLVAIGFVCLSVCGYGSDYGDRLKIVDQQSFEQRYGGVRKLLVDTTHGYVHVTAGSGNDVVVKVSETIRAESAEALAEGKAKVKLDVSQQGSYLRLYVDAPWRISEGGMNYRGSHYYGYEPAYDFEVQVPRNIDLTIRTVSKGDVKVAGTNGEYDIKSVNGPIAMDDVAGWGMITTVNGGLNVRLRENPAKPTAFKTLNGSVDIYFQPGLSADLRFKTFNGSVYTDFDVDSRPELAKDVAERKDGKFVYRSNRAQVGRVGKGGAELSFETFNGSIRLHTIGK